LASSALFLLGSPRIERPFGAPLEVDTRKALALVAYLAVTRQPQTRDALAGLLWPEYGQSRARAALRRTLSALQHARSDGWLVADRESVGLVEGDLLWVDLREFRNKLAQRRAHGHPEGEVCPECLPLLGDAVDLYRGDFMAGFGLRDSVEFDDWQLYQTEELRGELAGALDRLARGHGALAEWEPAIAHARRRLALDPLHEPAHATLMRLYALSGQRAAALRQYRECVRLLQAELGVPPLEETTALYRSITEEGAPPFSEGLSASSTREEDRVPRAAPPPESPLVGRAEEWEALHRAYAATKDGGRVAVLEGAAGIGKTRLAEEFLDHVRAKGAAQVVAARCYAGQSNLAYGPFVEALSAARAERLEELPERHRIEAGRLLPELAGPSSAPPLEGPGARSRFFEGVRGALLALCSGPSPGVLFLDDLHWADDSSLDLLSYLVRRLGEKRPLFVLLTWRDEEVPPGHRLRALVSESRRAGTGTLLRLGRLSRSATVELVRSATGDGELGEKLHGETEGQPLFLSEYLAAISGGVLSAEDAAWPLPGGVRDLLHGRLADLGGTAWQLLTAAAVIGRSFGFDAARATSGRGEEEAVAALEELGARGLIEEAGDGAAPAYDFSHEKLRELVYEETSLARRRLLHRRFAGFLASRSRGAGPAAGRIAHHYRLAGHDAEAAEYSKLAGEHARALYANRDALSHFQTALALGYPDAAALHENVGDLHTLLGEYGAALAGYEAAAALREGEALARVERKLGDVYARQGEWDLAESHYEAALEALGRSGPAGELARVHADRSLLEHNRGRPERAADLARRAMELAEEAGDTRALARAHNILGVLAGDPEEARLHLEKSLAFAEALDDHGARLAALNNLARLHGAAGEIAQAIERTEAALALCVALGDRHREAALHNNLADLLHAAGRREESMDHLRKAVTIFAEVGEEGALRPGIWKLVEW